MCSRLIVQLGSQFMCYVMRTRSYSGTWLVRRVLLLGVVQSYIGGLADPRAATITYTITYKIPLLYKPDDGLIGPKHAA